MKMYNRQLSFLIGFFVTTILMSITYFTVPDVWNNGLLKFVLVIVICLYFGYGGLARVPIGFQGVLLVLGGRTNTVLSEGWNWILPKPIMDLEDIDIKEHTSDPGSVTVISKDGVRITADAAIQWSINNPPKSLSVGKDVIKTGMAALIEQVLRAEIAKKSVEEAIGMHEDICNILEGTAKKKSVDWGIDIRNVMITEIKLNEEVIRDFERVTRERKQTEAEEIELNKVMEWIDKFTTKGYPLEVAQNIVQTERNKVKRIIQEVKKTYGVSNNITDLAEAVLKRLNKK